MSKKMMLLALSVVSAALFALPAVAGANTAHINAMEPFTVSAGPTTVAGHLETTGGEKVSCHQGVTGNGGFDTTTTGWIELEFHNCTAFGGLVTCTSHATEGGTPGSPAGTISTTKLIFHLITDPVSSKHAGVLITSNADHFASFTCAGSVKKVTGNGILGTITSPTCGAASTTATLSFKEGASTGVQALTTYTGTTYGLKSNGTAAAETAEAQLKFGVAKTITCT